jgi:hypothetical protein
MMPCYSDASRFAKTSWNDALESGRPESYISAPLAGSQAPGSAEHLINQAEIEPSAGSTITAGRPSQLKNTETSLKSNDAIVKSSTDSIPKDANTIMSLEWAFLKKILENSMLFKKHHGSYPLLHPLGIIQEYSGFSSLRSSATDKLEGPKLIDYVQHHFLAK